MTFRNLQFAVLLAILSGQAAVAQFLGGGMGGFGGSGGSSRFGKLSDASQDSKRSPKASWRPWLGVTGNYVDNPVYFNSNGELVTSKDQRGITGSWGISGDKSFENTSVAATYLGSALLRTSTDTIRGASNVATFGVNHRFNRNIYGGVQQLFGSTLGGFGIGSGFTGIGSGLYGYSGALGAQLGFGNPGLNAFVDEELVSNRVKFSGTSGTLGYQMNLRSMITVYGMAQFARRTNPSLSDLNAYHGGASYSYALSRSTFLGVNYSMGRFTYPNRFGGNKVQSLGAFVGRRISDRASISGGLGANYFDSSFIGTVKIDPDLAGLLGISAVTEVQTARRLTWGGELTASYNADIAHVSVHAQRGVSPGNGILYGGIRDILAFTAGRSLFNSKLTGTLNASLSRNSGIIQREVQTRYQTGLWLNYRIGAGIFVSAGGGLRWHRVATTGPYLPSKYASIGLGWSPGDYPLFF